MTENAPARSTRSDFALVVPAFNEAPVVPDLIRELKAAWASHGLSGEVVLVDDILVVAHKLHLNLVEHFCSVCTPHLPPACDTPQLPRDQQRR